MFSLLTKWKREHDSIVQYSATVRFPFYDIAKKYVPQNYDAVVVDVGPGEGDFAEYLEFKHYPNHVLLDINSGTVLKLKGKGFNALEYGAPNRLPFNNNSVSFIHLSHVVEHLPYQELYILLKDFDRVLSTGGVLVISAPLLWDRFYEDLSHVKPYNPEVFINYMTRVKNNPTQAPASINFVVRQLQYRYRAVDASDWGSRFFAVDVIIRIFRVFRSRLGFRKYIRNGYTLVLEKQVKQS